MNVLFLPAVFAFVLLLGLQARQPLRQQKHASLPRIARNLLFALPALLINRIALVPIPLLVAQWTQTHPIGLIHWLALPDGIKVLCGVLALDYAYYGWHIATHRVPLLWRFHRVHHADPDMDVSTAVRFHWGELLISIGFRVGAILLLGVSPLSFLIYELLFELAGQFHHSNWRLPLQTEKLLSRVFITPRLHGVHHSMQRDEMDSNWGTLFSWWDTLHCTRSDDVPEEQITIGVPNLRDEARHSVLQLWMLPFRRS